MKKTILAVIIILLSYSCSDDGKDEYDITDDLSYLNFPPAPARILSRGALTK